VYQNAAVGRCESLEQQKCDSRERGGRTQGGGDDYRVEETRGAATFVR